MDSSLDVIGSALALRKDATFNALSRRLSFDNVDRYLLETEDGSFNVTGYAYDGLCTVKPKGDVHGQFETGFVAEHSTYWQEPYNAWLEISWQGHLLEVVTVGQQGQHCRTVRHFVLA